MKEMCSLCCQTGEGIGDTDFGYTLSLISGKYKLVIMYWLANHKEVMRYSEIKRCMGNISHKTLSATLKEMEADRLIVRKEYPQIPPKSRVQPVRKRKVFSTGSCCNVQVGRRAQR